MDIRAFISGCRRIIKLSSKPSREELWTSIKICLLGVAVIGGIGFIIKFISAMLQGFTL